MTRSAAARVINGPSSGPDENRTTNGGCRLGRSISEPRDLAGLSLQMLSAVHPESSAHAARRIDDRAPQAAQPSTDSTSGDADPAVLGQQMHDAVAAGRVIVPIGWVCDMDDIVRVHTDMEARTITGELVVRTR